MDRKIASLLSHEFREHGFCRTPDLNAIDLNKSALSYRPAATRVMKPHTLIVSDAIAMEVKFDHKSAIWITLAFFCILRPLTAILVAFEAMIL